MTEIDVRFDRVAEANLSSLVGKTMLSYAHTPFVFTNSVSQFVRFSVSGELWYLYCFTEPLDYYGSIEDVSVLSFESKEFSFFQDKQCIETPIGETIKRIIVVQENQKLFENHALIYDVWLTRGIIFDFGNHQVSFEKGAWLSEQIIIRKGYDLLSEFTPTNAVMNDFSEDAVVECERQTVIFE